MTEKREKMQRALIELKACFEKAQKENKGLSMLIIAKKIKTVEFYLKNLH